MEDGSKYERAVGLVEAMDDGERLQFYAWLSQRMGWHYAPKVKGDRERLRHYAEVMGGIVGGDVMARTRSRDIVTGRSIVMHRMLSEGVTTVWLGRMFGLSHCTVMSARANVEDWIMMPHMHKNEVAVYSMFNEKIEEDGKD